jgi:endonuclease/exonuclease/phosphatase family metal-dependent hydrolase
MEMLMQESNRGAEAMIDTQARRGHVILFAISFLLFIQCWTFWVESIYRYSLVKLAPGPEMASLTFIFTPLLTLFVPMKWMRAWLAMALVSLLAVRLGIAVMPFPWAFAVAGLGAGAGLTLLCILFSGPYRLSGAQTAHAIGLALLASVALRAWGSSLDISMSGPGMVIGLALAAWAVFLLRRPGWTAREVDVADGAGMLQSAVGMIGVFANFTFLYLAFFSPAVISAWTDANYWVIVPLVAGAWALALVVRPAVPARGILLVWNLLFVACLAGSLYAHTPLFPASPDAPAVTVGVPSLWMQLPLYLLCALSPVIYVNLRTLLDHLWMRTPRAMAVPVFLGAIFMLAMTLGLIYTNVWGYVGAFGESLRGKFYLPFLITGVVSALAVAVVGRRDALRGYTLNAALPLALAILALAGMWVKAGSMADATATEKRLTVLTYNMQQGSAVTGEPNWHAQLDFLRAVNADIIALQESDMPRPSGGNVDASRYFADALGYYRYFGPATVGGTFGTAILSRFPLESPRSFYSYSNVDEIATAVVEIEVAGRRIAFINSHPAGHRDAHQAHADALIERVRTYDYVIAVGDYNCRQDSPWYAEITAALKDSWLSLYPGAIGPRHPSIGRSEETEPLDMRERIDHIFVSDSFNIEEAWYVPVPKSETDHPAHWAVLTWE